MDVALRQFYAVRPDRADVSLRLTAVRSGQYTLFSSDERRDARVHQSAAALRGLQIYFGLVSFAAATGSATRALVTHVRHNLLYASLLDRTARRAPFSLGEPRDKLPVDRYRLDQVSALGEGAFGCVTRVPLKKAETPTTTAEVALKLQIIDMAGVLRGDEVDRHHKWATDTEAYSLKRATYLRRFLRGNPFSVLMFDAYTAEFTQDVVSALAPVREQCDEVKFPRRVVAPTNKLLHVIEMELVRGGTAQNLPQLLSAEQIQSMCFQLIYSILALNRSFQMRHNDIKPENVLFQDARGSEGVTFLRFHVNFGGENKLLMPLGADSDPYLFKLSDLGGSTSDEFTSVRLHGKALASGRQYRTGTIEWQPPETWLYYDFDPVVRAQNGQQEKSVPEAEAQYMPPRDLGSDVWAVGLMVLMQALNGWDVGALNMLRGTWKEFEAAGEEVYSNLPPVGILFDERAIKKEGTNLLTYAKRLNEARRKRIGLARPGLTLLPGGDLHVVSEELFRRIVPTLLLLHAIGNPMPREESEADGDYTFGSLHKYLVTEPVRQGRTLRSGRAPLDTILELGKGWKEGGARDSLFDLAARHARDRIGEEGMDFVRRCLDWSPAQRTKFARNITVGSRESALGHPFLARLQREDFRYDSSEVPAQDYFLF